MKPEIIQATDLVSSVYPYTIVKLIWYIRYNIWYKLICQRVETP